MKRQCLILFILISYSTYAQKVGLVLSGGAAKGIAHVGVLKALEENEIPIDYIVGTSMGGIIAGCYAAGMSPEQIEHLVLSEPFLRWVNGQPEIGYNYFYHRTDDDPHFLRVNLSLDSILNLQLNTSLASDVSLNFALAEKMSHASAISGNNFDKLFVPLRVVAADIFTQNQVILKDGILSDALRATQTVPFFYNPIRVNGKYLFDGGVYNNFPVDVAQQAFNPDVILGVNVSTKIYNEYPYTIDEKLIANSLLFLLLDKSDPASVPENGVYIQPNLKGYSSFDFAQAKSLVDSGYAQTIRQIEEIKQKVNMRVTCEDVAVKRNIFNSRNPEFIFDEVKFVGFNSKQRKFLKRFFHFNSNKPEKFYYSKVKSNYFKLVSETYFSNAYPNILYDTVRKAYQFQLTRRPQKNFQVDFGGVIATRDISNIFLGLNFFNFDQQLIHVFGGFYTGNFYKAAVLNGRMDFPWHIFISPSVSFRTWDYLDGEDLLKEIKNPTILKRIDRSVGFRIGWPFGINFKNTIGIEGFNNVDTYGNREAFISTDTLDELRLSGYKTELIFSTNSLNRKQYASSGSAYSLSAQFFSVRENYDPGNTSLEKKTIKDSHQFFRVKFSAEQYINAGRFRPGYYAEAVFSNQPFFKNYKGTIINAPAFQPLQDSRTLLLENFRAFNYVAGGFRNVISLRKKLDFRLEAYVFKPIEYISQGPNQEAITVDDFKRFYWAGTAGLVMHSPIGPISFSINYYDDKQSQLGVLLHAGFLLYGKHSFE